MGRLVKPGKNQSNDHPGQHEREKEERLNNPHRADLLIQEDSDRQPDHRSKQKQN
jgi:hypothetical protein